MRFLREPLFHFVVLGAAIFAWFLYLNPVKDTPQSARQIVIDEQDIERLALRFEATQRRPPSEAEMTLLVKSLLRQEILVREAEALGLDAGDEVIRNRLTQKMTFLLQSVAQAEPPDDAVLQEYLNANASVFTQPAMIAFEQVFLGEGSDAATREALLAQLASGANPAQLGTPSTLPGSIPLAPMSRIDATFGRGFAEALERLALNEWSGPVPSGYGDHFVRVTRRDDATLPPLDMIRENVLNAWMLDTAKSLADARYEALKESYDITLPAAYEALGKADES